MKKTAIVVGATGLVGKALVDQLAIANHIGKINTLTRRPAKHASTKVFNQVVDFDRLEDWAELFRGDCLFSCLGTTRKQAGSIALQRKVDLDFQYNAAKLAAGNGVHHYLLVSSSGADDKSSNQYLKMKGELEEKVKSLPFKRISIFQPSLLSGHRPEFRLGEELGGWLLKVLCFIPYFSRFRPITGEQVASKMIQVSQTPGDSIEWFRLDEIFVE